MDLGQTIVVADRACVAVEAMEGTDAAIQRAASLSNGRRLVVVKVSKPHQDMRFDVPVVGRKTIQVMQQSKASVLAVDAGKTLLFDRQNLIADANEAGIAIVGCRMSGQRIQILNLNESKNCRCGLRSQFGIHNSEFRISPRPPRTRHLPRKYMGEKIPVAVLGVGEHGKKHARSFEASRGAELAGCLRPAA